MKKPATRKNRPGAGRPKGTTKAPTERLHVRLPLGTVAFLEARAGGMGMSVAAMLANGACPECMEEQPMRRPIRGVLELARDAADNILRNGRLCPNDTDGDGDCGRRLCPVCGERANSLDEIPGDDTMPLTK